ncbi:MAG: ATP-binding protein [Cyclobacteriaceae bacterium]
MNSLRRQLLWRVALILILGYAAVYIVTQTYFWLVGVWLALFTVVAIIFLIRYLERQERDLTNFLTAISQGDFTYASNIPGKDNKLRTVYEQIMQVFKRLSSEKESHHQLLQTIVEHVSIGIAVFNKQEEVIVTNKATALLFGQQRFKYLSRLFDRFPDLHEKIAAMRQGSSFLYKYVRGGRVINLSVKSSVFQLKGAAYTVVSFQDIKNELEENELDSWQKLIRVLTHEIMNSAIPISTLTSVIRKTLLDDHGNQIKVEELSDESIEDLVGGLSTIENRSKGLVKFTEAYRSLTQIGPPDLADVQLDELIDRVITLLKSDLQVQGIDLKMTLDAKISLKADAQLIEQVMINLLKNGMEALYETELPRLIINSEVVNERVQLSIIDNGPGMGEETIDQIFIPFFSTKKRGSGIGLSLCRQILRAHGGRIEVESTLGKGSSFRLIF